MYLYHYFDKTIGPFASMSDLSIEEANNVLRDIKETKPNSQAAGRHDKYVEYRRNCEKILKAEFIKKGGVIKREVPHYMVIGHSPCLRLALRLLMEKSIANSFILMTKY